MLKMKRGLLAVLLLAGLGLAVLADEAPKPPEAGTLVLIDAGGKEQKLKAWKFTAGIQRLSWLAPPVKEEDKPAKDKAVDNDKTDKRRPARPAAVGPEALVVREELKIHFLAGVTTFVPLD